MRCGRLNFSALSSKCSRRCCSICMMMIWLVAFMCLLIVGIVLMAHTNTKTDNLRGFQLRNCTLRQPKIMKIPLCHSITTQDEYIVVWEDVERGTSVISNPFSATKTLKSADWNIDNFPLNVTLPCMCHPETESVYPNVTDILDCNVWGACMLDIQIVQEFQFINQKLYQNGAVIVTTLMVTLVIFCLAYFLVRCLCPKLISRDEDESYFELSNEK